MKILIIGAGQVGSTLAQNLSLEHDVTVVDYDQDQLMLLQSRLDIRTIAGNGADPEVLAAAGANDADIFIAVTSNDECNMLACQIAYCLFKTPAKIARVRGQHFEAYPQLFEPGNLAVDTLINPAQLVTQRLLRQIQHPGTMMVLDFANASIQVASIRATPPCPLIGRKVRELTHDLAGLEARVVALLRDRKMLLVDGDMIIQPHDELYYIAKSKDLNKATHALLQNEQRFRRIMIAGGGNIGTSLASQLENDYNVKVLEQDPEKSERAAEALHQAVVLMGDAADAELLQSENIDEVDLFCSLTNDDEANIMSAILAKRLGAKTTIALVNRQTYAHYLIERSPDIDMAISPQRITGGKILTFLRKGDIVNVYPLPRGFAEVLEIVVHGDEKGSKVVGRALSKIKMPSGCAICAVYREKKMFLPEPDTKLQDGDNVVLFVTDRSDLPAVEKLFQVSPNFL